MSELKQIVLKKIENHQEFDQLAEIYYNSMVDQFERLELNKLEPLILSPRCLCVVAKAGDTVIGFIYGILKPDSSSCLGGEFAVERKYRSLELARLLAEDFLNRLRELGVKKLEFIFDQKYSRLYRRIFKNVVIDQHKIIRYECAA
ncbi:MAG: GNAT family N-acetyltransferase [Candidatus Omnitrophota bacterium]